INFRLRKSFFERIVFFDIFHTVTGEIFINFFHQWSSSSVNSIKERRELCAAPLPFTAKGVGNAQ
ncbi:MAG: hypothetical protein AAGJ50_16025, partial [Pseudomonadota bacterium]